MIQSIVLLAVLATVVLSGVLGMAGGMVLMAVLVSVLPVAAAMVPLGATQGVSNGARVLFLRRHVVWAVGTALLHRLNTNRCFAASRPWPYLCSVPRVCSRMCATSWYRDVAFELVGCADNAGRG